MTGCCDLFAWIVIVNGIALHAYLITADAGLAFEINILIDYSGGAIGNSQGITSTGFWRA